MALTPAQIALCAAMFGAGVATTPFVEKVKRTTAPKPVARAKEKPKPAVRMTAPLPGGGSITILDCPVVAPVFAPIPPLSSSPGEARFSHGGPPTGGDVGGSLPPTSPPSLPAPPDGAVPEPGAWAMMIAGFGLIGLAARQRVVA